MEKFSAKTLRTIRGCGRYQDRTKAYQPPCEALHSLSLLLSFRHRLLDNKHALPVAAKELRSVYQRDTTARYVYERSQREIEHLNREIKAAEAKMEELIRENEEIRRNCERVSSIKVCPSCASDKNRPPAELPVPRRHVAKRAGHREK